LGVRVLDQACRDLHDVAAMPLLHLCNGAAHATWII
jgi:hypothetical protein